MSISFDKNNNSFFIYNSEEIDLNLNSEPYDIEPFDNSLLEKYGNDNIIVLQPTPNIEDFIFQYMSPNFVKYYGVGPEAFFGKTVKDVYPTIGTDLVLIYKEVYETKEHQVVYCNYYNKNSLSLCLKFIIECLDDEHLVINVEDITSQIKISELSSLNHSSSYIQKNKKYGIGTQFENGIFSWSDGIYQILEREPRSYDKTHNIVFEIIVPEERDRLESLKQHLRDYPEKSCQDTFRILTDENKIKSIKIDIKKIFKRDYHEKTVAIIYDLTDELKSKKRLRIMSDLNATIYNNFNISSFIVNYETNYYFVSDNITEILNLTKKNPKLMIYDFMNNIISPEFRMKREQIHKDEINILEGVYDYKSPNNDKILKIRIKYFKKVYEGETYYVGGVQDVTQKFEDELKLINKNEKINLLKNTLIDAEKSNLISIPYLDANNRYHWPQGIYDMLEREPSPNDAKENIILNATDKETREELEEIFNTLNETEMLNNREIKITTDKGNVKYLELNVRNIYDDKGNFIQQSGFCRDITKNHDKNEEIKILTEVMQKIDTNLGTGAYIWDPETDLMIITDSAREITHLKHIDNPHVVLQEFKNNLIESDKYRALLKKVYHGDLNKIDDIYDYQAPGHDLQKIKVRYQKITVRNRDFWVAGIKDVTEEIERENEIIAANKNMQMLISESNHRIKNNLNMLLRFISLEKKFNSNPEQVLENLSGRINSLVIFHEKLAYPENKYDVDAPEACREMIKDLYKIYKELTPGIKFEYETNEHFKIPNEKLAPILFILVELVTNSMKYAYEGYDIENKAFYASLKKEGNICECFLKDNGKGYPEGFDPHTSTGLGWIVIISLTKQLDGEFEIYNDDGACFKLRFPIR